MSHSLNINHYISEKLSSGKYSNKKGTKSSIIPYLLMFLNLVVFYGNMHCQKQTRFSSLSQKDHIKIIHNIIYIDRVL